MAYGKTGFPSLDRRSALALMASAALASCGKAGPSSGDRSGKLFAGDQRGGSRIVLEGAGKLAGTPYEIVWSQFPNAAPLLEALNAGAIDTGIGGDSAFIFAIGSGATIKAIGAQETTGLGPVIVVRGDSPIRDLGGLAGKTIATPRGSISHNHVLAVLEAYDQPYDAVRFASLTPSDGRAALHSGAVDAWAIWDPNAALAEREGARILKGKQDLVPGYSFMFARDGAIAEKRALLKDYHDRLYTGWQWAHENEPGYRQLMHRDTGLPIDILAITTGRSDRQPVPIDDAVIAAEQQTADRYLRAGVLAKRVEVSNGFDRSFA
ncbi:MAG: aliphatic sulfonate ABC transporter substrate-binding protein [Novosphingobium sp.]|nr:MAG: aliphatic sulfonate ABC transporter substrate-binding protein [Novosphingobium sp.]